MTEKEQFSEKILSLLQEKKYSALQKYMDTLNPADIAECMEDLLDDGDIQEEELPRIFRLLPKELASDTFTEMEPEFQEKLIEAFSDKELAELMGDMFLDDTVDVIEEMPANVVKRILKNVDSETRKSINQVLNYPEDSAGSIMTIEYVDLRPGMTVQEAFARIRQTGVDKETIYICYIIGPTRKLLGLVSVRELLLAKDDTVLRDIMETNIISVTTLDDREDVANLFAKYSFGALPVVDKENRLVGIVTVDDAIDVLQEEATEDIEKMAAITPSEHPYLRAKTWEIWKQRIPWLLLLMVSATFTGMIITGFENALAAQAALMAFIPMLMDTGGNSGSQASVTVIRNLSLGEVEFADIGKVLWKELRVSVMCGATLAAVAFGKVMLIDGLLMKNPGVTVTVAAVVCLTLLLTVVVAKLVGCSLPLLAKKIGFDPAVMASPFITTIVDALSLILYFRIATVILHL
ncbi:MAG: magnesium transporter [Clostridia bacterium]|nr:magnesium transporter [Clostridia bacterium]